MTIFQKMMLLFAASIIVISCSKDQGAFPEETQEANLSMTIPTSHKKPFDYFESTRAVLIEMDNEAPRLPLDQATVDYYLDLANVKERMDVDTANTIVDESFYAAQKGLEAYLNERTQLSEFTKITLVKISEEGAIVDIQSEPEFEDLPRHEQEIILQANEIASSYFEGQQNRTSSCYIVGEPAPCSLTLAIVGGVAGYYICNWPCAVGGAIIGGIIGWFVDTK